MLIVQLVLEYADCNTIIIGEIRYNRRDPAR